MMNSEKSESVYEEDDKVLYVRLPHTIKNVDQVKQWLVGDYKVKLPRKKGRHCHVVFTTVEERMRNLRASKDVVINGKQMFACSPKEKIHKEVRIKPDKKVVIPIPKKPAEKLTRILFVCNINPITKIHEVQAAFEGVRTSTFIKGPIKNTKQAIIKLEDAKVAAEYLTKKRPAPILHGHKLVIKPDTRKQNKKKISPSPKVQDGEVDITNKVALKDNNVENKKKKNKNNKKDTVPVHCVESEEVDAESGLKAWDGEADITEEVEFKDKAPVKKTRKVKQD